MSVADSDSDDNSDSDSDDEFVNGDSNINDTSDGSTTNEFTGAASGDVGRDTSTAQSDDFFSSNFADFEVSGLPQQHDDFGNFDTSFETNFENMSVNTTPVDGGVVDSDLTTLTSPSSSNIDPFGDGKVDVSIFK